MRAVLGVVIAQLMLLQTALAHPAAAAAPKRPLTATASEAVTLKTVNRDLLVLFDSANEAAPHQTRVHQFLEMPLNHLGYRLTYWDLRSGFPALDAARQYHAVITWFELHVPDPNAYVDWASDLARGGTRFVIMENIGTPFDRPVLPRLNAFLAHVGIQVKDEWVPKERSPKVIVRTDAMLDFERTLDEDVSGYMLYKAAPNAAAHVVVGLGPQDPEPSVQVVTSKGGGFAGSGFVNHYDPAKERLSWILNPFVFLTQALGQRSAPIADVTTLAGRRIYFSHIDGDAWNNPSDIPGLDGKRATVAEIVRDTLIAPYPDLPVSIGPIARDMAPTTPAGARGAAIARNLFEWPQVEVASHTHSHPFRWPFFAAYNREAELKMIEARAARSTPASEKASGDAADAAYRSGTNDMPRAFMDQPFDLATEVAGALDVSKSLAPAGKLPRLYLWSGDTAPFEAAIKATRAYGAFNLNGGDARLDTEYPSIAYVPPIGRPVGRERQIYAVNSNENTYTNGWSGPFDGFARLHETWRNTDLPRRLKATNLYYHMYSGQKPESVAAVRAHLEIARAGPVIPIAASEYAAIANAFYGTEITRTGAKAWRISNRGALNTFRFDNADQLTVDYAKSAGVLGHNRHGGALYVALDPAVDTPALALADTSAAAPDRSYLVESRWQISNLSHDGCGFRFEARGFGAGDMVWAGLRPGNYQIAAKAHATGQRVALPDVALASSGELSWTLPALGIDGMSVTVHCMGELVAAQSPKPKPVQAASVPRRPTKGLAKQTKRAAGATFPLFGLQ